MNHGATFRIDGQVTKSPEPRYKFGTGERLDMLAFSVTVDGRGKEEPNTFDCEAWKEAQAYVANLVNGQTVRVEGRIVIDKFTTQRGKTYERTKYFVSTCLLHAGSPQGGQQYASTPRAQRRDSYAPPPSGSDPQELGYGSRNSRAASTQSMADSDIPF